ncbi:MAG: cytochrome c maturation protein CcmE [Balneolales bacterium]
MKPRLIIGIISIVAFTSLLMFNFSQNISSYVDFEQAASLDSDRVHVVGVWDSDKPSDFSNETQQFTFHMTDESGNSRRVVYPRAKPTNFEQAEQVVVIGEMKNDVFYSNEMLVKCPSKYNDGNELEFTQAE